jgi:integrative and conjugative element protein (TIGR02256 family)
VPHLPAIPEVEFAGRVFALGPVFTTLAREGDQYRFCETGGVLFGYHTDDNDLVITQATGPGPRARHGWRSFEPDTRYCQERLEAVFQESEGAISYVGEWHTHPHGGLRPSRLDFESMMELARDPDVRLRQPALWIFRPASLLGWKRPAEHAVWVLDSSMLRWQRASPQWLNRIPGE